MTAPRKTENPVTYVRALWWPTVCCREEKTKEKVEEKEKEEERREGAMQIHTLSI